MIDKPEPKKEYAKIVYVGPKPTKVLHRDGIRYPFTRGVPLSVEQSVANELLALGNIFVTPEESSAAIAKMEEKEEKAKAKAEEIKAAAEAEEPKKPETFEVYVGTGEMREVGKLPRTKLTAIIEDEELDIPLNLQLPEMAKQVRDALHDKYGVPMEGGFNG